MKADQKTNYLYIVRDAGAVHLRKIVEKRRASRDRHITSTVRKPARAREDQTPAPPDLTDKDENDLAYPPP